MNNRNGFSLIEVLVAVAILSIATVAVMRNFSQSLYNVGKSSASLHYSYSMRFFFEEAIRMYGSNENEEEMLSFENDVFIFEFTFSEPEFLADDYDTSVPGIEIKKIDVEVKVKETDRTIYQQESFHVFKRTGRVN